MTHSEFCFACGMPLDVKEMFGARLADGGACVYCINVDKELKAVTEIFEGGVQFFLSAIPGTTREFAERIVRKNMNDLPYWRTHHDPILDGPRATDEEFQKVLQQL